MTITRKQFIQALIPVCRYFENLAHFIEHAQYIYPTYLETRLTS